MRYRLTSRAKREATRAHAWWRENRPAASELFLTELSEAFELLITAPLVGAPYGSHDGVLVRRVLLVRSGFYLYYQVDDRGALVLSVWAASRGRGPRFRSTH